MKNWSPLIEINLFVATILSTIIYGVKFYKGIYLSEVHEAVILCSSMGMGGSIISLAISKWMAKKPIGNRVTVILTFVQGIINSLAMFLIYGILMISCCLH